MTAEREVLAEEVMALADVIFENSDEPMWSAVVIAKAQWDALADLLAARDRRVRAEAVESVAQAIEAITPAAPHTITPKTAGAQATRSALLLAARIARAEADA